MRTVFYPGSVARPIRLWNAALQLFLHVSLAFTLLENAAHAEENWPIPQLPVGLETFAIGQQMTVNGLPMRLRGFLSSRAPDDLLPALRESLGQPLVEDKRGARQVLGRAEGNYYITVQLEGTASGSRGTVAVTDIAGALKGYPVHRNSTERWLDRLPAGSTIASDLSSDDGGRTSQHLVYVNRQGALRNRDGVLALMKSDGYALEREVAGKLAGVGTLYFSAPGKEAMAVIARNGETTSVILNLVTRLAAFK
ncbi:MAG: hypothetical protein H7234_00210 [Herminiimonas sp.]|nr:hypothetical protein [Herminiimonas sp.]